MPKSVRTGQSERATPKLIEILQRDPDKVWSSPTLCDTYTQETEEPITPGLVHHIFKAKSQKGEFPYPFQRQKKREFPEDSVKRLSWFIARHSNNAKFCQRARAVRLVAQGQSGQQVAQQMDLRRSTVDKYVRRFLEHGTLGLRHNPNLPSSCTDKETTVAQRDPFFSPEFEEKVRSLLSQKRLPPAVKRDLKVLSRAFTKHSHKDMGAIKNGLQRKNVTSLINRCKKMPLEVAVGLSPERSLENHNLHPPDIARSFEKFALAHPEIKGISTLREAHAQATGISMADAQAQKILDRGFEFQKRSDWPGIPEP